MVIRSRDIFANMEIENRDLRREASAYAMRFVHSGMMLGIGTGKTVGYFIELLGGLFQQGDLHHIQTVPTSINSANMLKEYGIPIVSLSDIPTLDLAIDGADEVDPALNLIKGLGRALLREKVVEVHAQELLILVDETKLVQKLGTTCPLPVEILAFEAQSHIRWLNTLGCRAELRLEEDGSPVVTDNGNLMALMWFDEGIPNAYDLDQKLNNRPGILEHGLFLDMTTRVIAACNEGIHLMERDHGS